MIVYDWCRINELAVKQVGKPAVYVSNNLSYNSPEDEKESREVFSFVHSEIRKMAKDDVEFYQIIGQLTDTGLFFFDTVEEQQAFYKIFEQPLTESSGIYACTYAADGTGMTENT